jgi:4-nitrophenyl phosphatase
MDAFGGFLCWISENGYRPSGPSPLEDERSRHGWTELMGVKHKNPIRGAVFDIDGTLALMDKDKGTYTALPGAVEAVNALKARGLPVVAYTNGTFFPPEQYYAPLAAAGLHLEPGHILTPATVAARQLARLGYKRVMLIGAEGTRVPLQQAGIGIVEAEAGAPGVDAVLLAWTKEFHSKQLEAAAKAIWGGAKLYATSVAPYFAGAGGKIMGVSGGIAAALNNATGVKATVYGKPSVDGLEIVSEITKVAAAELIVVGDDPKLEIAMARKGGAFAVGVTSGVADQAAFKDMPPKLRAHVVVPDLLNFASQPWIR